MCYTTHGVSNKSHSLIYLVGNLREQRLPSCVQLHLEYFYRRRIHNLLGLCTLARTYSKVEDMLKMTGGKPRLMNLHSFSAKPKGDGGSKGRFPWQLCAILAIQENQGLFNGIKRRDVAG